MICKVCGNWIENEDEEMDGICDDSLLGCLRFDTGDSSVGCCEGCSNKRTSTYSQRGEKIR